MSHLQPMMHQCHDKHGELYSEEVLSHEIRDGTLCGHCGQELAPLKEVVAHIYRDLCEPW